MELGAGHPSEWCGPWKRQVTVFHQMDRSIVGRTRVSAPGRHMGRPRPTPGPKGPGLQRCCHHLEQRLKGIEMSSSSPTSLLNVDVQRGKPPMLLVDAADDAPHWAAEHRDALRAAIVEHGSLLVRGLRLRDVAEIEAVFRQLGSLMPEREAFAARRSYSHGVYSSSTWPPNQQMCMH